MQAVKSVVKQTARRAARGAVMRDDGAVRKIFARVPVFSVDFGGECGILPFCSEGRYESPVCAGSFLMP